MSEREESYNIIFESDKNGQIIAKYSCSPPHCMPLSLSLIYLSVVIRVKLIKFFERKKCDQIWKILLVLLFYEYVYL